MNLAQLSDIVLVNISSFCIYVKFCLCHSLPAVMFYHQCLVC